MAGRHSFAELRARMAPAAQAKAEAEALRLEEEMDLAEVRRALKLSQDEIAQTLQIGQGSVAKIEKRADMYVSTLRRFIEAMGGQLEIVARFSDHSVKIKNFADLSEKKHTKGRFIMKNTLFSVAAITALSITAFAPPATAGQGSSVGAFDICSLLNSGDASAITGDQNVVKRGGPPGFLCTWNSPGGENRISHDIVIMLWTQARMEQLKGRPFAGLAKDPKLATALSSGSPLGFFQSLSKTGKSCQGYSGNLPCTAVEERIALYKHTNAYDYVVVIFAQRNEGHGDAGIVRLVLDAAHVANLITPRLP